MVEANMADFYLGKEEENLAIKYYKSALETMQNRDFWEMFQKDDEILEMHIQS